jgi:hypothetical protein
MFKTSSVIIAQMMSLEAPKTYPIEMPRLSSLGAQSKETTEH